MRLAVNHLTANTRNGGSGSSLPPMILVLLWSIFLDISNIKKILMMLMKM